MGLFDRFKRKNNAQQMQSNVRRQEPTINQKPYDLDIKNLNDGSVQFEFTDNVYETSKNYDTTRLIVQSQSTVANKTVFNCLISWYDKENTVFFDENGQMYGDFNNYKSISVELDWNALQTNPDYIQTVMKELLTRERVTSHLNESLNGTRQCGNYMGGVFQKNGEYRKYLDEYVAMASHNSPAMVNERRRFFEAQRRMRNEQNAKDRAEIDRLQSRINQRNSGYNDDGR